MAVIIVVLGCRQQLCVFVLLLLPSWKTRAILSTLKTTCSVFGSAYFFENLWMALVLENPEKTRAVRIMYLRESYLYAVLTTPTLSLLLVLYETRTRIISSCSNWMRKGLLIRGEVVSGTKSTEESVEMWRSKMLVVRRAKTNLKMSRGYPFGNGISRYITE
jgi:hypothetical protein